MGIHGLSKVIADHAPSALRSSPISNYFSRTVAVDASMCLYQFLIAVRSADGNTLTNEAGEVTSHLMGIFYRTLRMVDNDIRPIYIFDGKPPQMKSGELAKRYERRSAAQESLETATEVGDAENVERFNKRMVKVTKEHAEEAKKLLGLMGIPFLTAPCEAEAQAATLVRLGYAYGVASEDMDTLSFGSPTLLRHMTYSEARKMPILEISLEETLKGLDMDMDSFIDLCILLGCDYCDGIRGIGPTRAVSLIKEHGSIEAILDAIDKNKYIVPESWPYAEARELFRNPDVITDAAVLGKLKSVKPDEEGVVQFLVKEKGFNEERIRAGVKKLMKPTLSQSRLDGFFKKIASPPFDKKSENNSACSEAKKTVAKKKASNLNDKKKGK